MIHHLPNVIQTILEQRPALWVSGNWVRQEGQQTLHARPTAQLSRPWGPELVKDMPT